MKTVAEQRVLNIAAMKQAELILLEAVFALDPPDRTVSAVRQILADSCKGAYADIVERRTKLEAVK